MRLIQNVPFSYPVLMISSSDHLTGKTGVPLTIYLSKAGGSSTLIAPTVTEIGFGKYSLHLIPEYVNTIGAWSLHIEAPGCDPFDTLDQVISAAAALIPASAPSTVLDLLKNQLGIALIDSSHDDELANLIKFAVSITEGLTKRYFGTPRTKVEYFRGDECEIILSGFIDDSDAANAAYPSNAPSQSVVVSRRGYRSSDAWDDLIEGEDWERRGRTIMFLGWVPVWRLWYEYRVTYLEGFADAPEDIKHLIVEIAVNQTMNDTSVASGMTGITSESLGDFSYSRNALSSTGLLSVITDIGRATIQRYKKRFI